MKSINHRTATYAATGLLAVSVAFLLAAPAFGLLASSHPLNPPPGSFHEFGESAALEQNETMPNFVHGLIFGSEYEQNYFVGSNTTMEPTVGTAATIIPSSTPANIGEFYVLVPWWGPKAAPYAPAYNLSTPFMCVPATVQTCFDHPATVDVPGLGVVPTPGHDHLLDGLHQFKDIWWKVTIVLVFHASAWPGVTGSQGIISDHNISNPPAYTESLDQAEHNGDAAEFPTNFFLDFAVLPMGDV